jgi:hypothetical protein
MQSSPTTPTFINNHGLLIPDPDGTLVHARLTFHELLEMGRNLGDKLSPRLTVIYQSLEKVGYQAKGLPKGVIVLGSHLQLAR